MKLTRDGTLVDIDTAVGSFAFRDDSGRGDVNVKVTGEFWRVVDIDMSNVYGLPPDAARALAKLLTRAADLCDRESKRLEWPTTPTLLKRGAL